MVITAATYLELYVPKSGEQANSITFHSEVTNKDYTHSVTEIGDVSNYHHFLVNLYGIPEGEYVYTIGEDKGVVRIGNYKALQKDYRHKETHKEYNIYG